MRAIKLYIIFILLLDKSFITPIDREDISRLTILYDNVLDAIWDVANRMNLMSPVEKLQYMHSFSVIIEKSVAEIDQALKLIRTMNRQEPLRNM